MEKSVMISGVGGQGTLLASRIIGDVAIQMGYDVKVSEVHGMSQRGGSVVTYVKFSDKKVYSPVISNGTADVVLAFELLEAYRSVPALKKGGKMVLNTQVINPMSVISGKATYPEMMVEKINDLGIDTISVNALDLAYKAGNQKAVNVVLLGIYAKYSDIPKEYWLKSMEKLVPKKFMEANLKAFELGYSA